MISSLFEWFGQLRGFELILWCIALFFSLLFLVQTVLSLVTGGDTDHDADGDGYHFFTIKNMIAFFTMFGWAGLAAYKGGLGTGLVTAIALASGIAMVLVMWGLMRNAGKLKHDGTLQMKNAVNKVGETYLRIPAARGGLGKVQVQVQGRYLELDAMTDDAADIATGRPIQVVNILSNQVLLVTSSFN
ncbi:hypothetical protein [Flaviaesturariibacter amylovorans]|uniref:Serine protease n=1 Tax=Flaviaesturariibacter amylovorans TaxID=1084520 RepID=A0ABP8H3A5_9BACT